MKMRHIAVITAVVLGTLTLVYLLWVFRLALVLFLFSLAIAAAARPYVEFLFRRGLKRGQAVLLVYLLFLASIALLFYMVGASFLRELQVLTDNMARAYDRIWTEWPEGTEVQQMIASRLPAPADLYESFSPERQNSALQGILGFTVTSAGFIGNLVTALILSIYWSIDQIHFERLWLSVVPAEARVRARDVWRNIERDFGAYVRSEILQSVIAGLLLGFGLSFMGVQYPTLLAVFGALAWLIPVMGGLLVLLPVTITALSQGIGLAIFASVYVIGILFFLEFYVESRFIHRERYSSLLSILLILALVEPFGLLGFLVAPPLAAAIELVFRYNLQARPKTADTEATERLDALRERIDQVRMNIISRQEQLEPQTASMLERMEGLIDKADEVLSKDRRALQPQKSETRP